jgi:hypothetical protein
MMLLRALPLLCRLHSLSYVISALPLPYLPPPPLHLSTGTTATSSASC